MPVVSIVELGRDDVDSSAATGTRHNSNRIFSVTNHTASHGSREQRFEIPPAPLELMDEIRWYLEDFAVVSPLETTRADRAKRSLQDVGRALVKSIKWALIVGPQERKETLLVSVQEQPCSSASPVVWELLEDSELWDEPFKGGVFVSRHSPKLGQIPTRTNGTSLNILIVAARTDGEGDIPHRIVSKILHDKIRRQSDQLARPTYLKVLRPPTWDEFNRELEAKGAGFYDMVHFDLHGRQMDDNRQGLAFADITPEKHGTGKYKLRMRGVSTSDLASALALHQVRRVVLNACRSAQHQDTDQSIALGILKAGVEECVAMTFDVVSRAVEIFMTIFYDAILTKGLSLDGAAAWARQALRLKPDRDSCYATSVPVYDYMIPVCYTHALPRNSDEYRFKGRSLQFSRRPPFNDVVGREDDILSIETRLLASEKWLWLCGRPGVGKTALLRHLGAWWKETGLATGVYLHDCRAAASQSGWSVEVFWRGAHDLLLPTLEYRDPGAVVGYLRQNRCIVMLDNLPPSADRPSIRFVAQILKKLDCGRTKVILATRSDKGWESLDCFFEPRRETLGGLSKHSSLQLLRKYMEKAVRDMTGQAAKSVGESSDDLHCFEQIALLLEGNPAALRVVVATFLHSRANTIKEFLTSLILSEPLMDSEVAQQHLSWMGQTQDLECVTELLGIVRGLTMPPAGEYAVPVEVLAPFWALLPRSDLPLFVAAYSDQVSNDMGGGSTLGERTALFKALLEQDGPKTPDLSELSPELQSIAAAAGNNPDSLAFIKKSPELKELLAIAFDNPPAPDVKSSERLHFLVKGGPDFADFVKQSPLHCIFSAACTRITDPLVAAHFLSEDPREPLGHSKTNYYRIHPLVPLLLRTSPLYHFYGTDGPGIKTIHIKQAHVFYYTYRARNWPTDRVYFVPEWEGIRAELGQEFINFVSATAMHAEVASATSEVSMASLVTVNMASVLHRGVGTEVSRFQLANIAQEKALDSILRQEQRIGASPGAATDPEKQQILFLLRLHGAGLAANRIAFVGSPTSPEKKRFAALGGALHRRLKQMSDPFLERMWAMADITPAQVRYADRCFEVAGDYARPGGVEAHFADDRMDEMWKLRQDFMRDSAAETGDTLYENHTSWLDIPRQVISGGKLRMELSDALERAREAMERGRLGEARGIVDAAWKTEVFERNDDRFHKARLLEMRAEICERGGDGESGAQHREEARRLLEEGAAKADGMGPRAALGSFVDGFLEGLGPVTVLGDGCLSLQESWGSILFWQMTVTPMDASGLWLAIFVSQVMKTPSDEPWVAIFFWHPTATLVDAPVVWTAVFMWCAVPWVIARWIEYAVPDFWD